MVTFTPGMTLASVEKQAILESYLWYGKNKAKTAKVLGISENTLRSKLELYEKQSLANEERTRSDNERAARGIEQFKAQGLGSQPRLPVESDVKKGLPQRPVSVFQRPEIQEVSPGQNASGNTDASHTEKVGDATASGGQGEKGNNHSRGNANVDQRAGRSQGQGNR